MIVFTPPQGKMAKIDTYFPILQFAALKSTYPTCAVWL
jgi:hypothetical protein